MSKFQVTVIGSDESQIIDCHGIFVNSDAKTYQFFKLSSGGIQIFVAYYPIKKTIITKLEATKQGGEQ
jgi:hypothetical protein